MYNTRKSISAVLLTKMEPFDDEPPPTPHVLRSQESLVQTSELEAILKANGALTLGWGCDQGEYRVDVHPKRTTSQRNHLTQRAA